MSQLRAVIFAVAALAASVALSLGAFGAGQAPCTPAGLESRLARLEAAAEQARQRDPALAGERQALALYARTEAARFAPEERFEACRFLDRLATAANTTG